MSARTKPSHAKEYTQEEIEVFMRDRLDLLVWWDERTAKPLAIKQQQFKRQGKHQHKRPFN